MIEAVIFDLDGTLEDIPIDYEKLYRQAEEQTEIKIKGLTKTLQTVSKEKRDKVFEIWTTEEIRASPKMTLNGKGLKIYKNFSDKPRAFVDDARQKR